jgi:hypothetical protein
MISGIWSCLVGLDQFGATVGFQINGSSQYKTCLGGFLFLLYAMLSLAYFIYNFIGFITRQNMTLISTYKILDSPKLINFSESNFSIAFTVLYDKNNSVAIDNLSKYFDFSFNLVNLYDGKKKNKVLIPTVKCEKEYFGSISEEIFTNLQLDTAICPSKEIRNNLSIVGKFGDPEFRYIHARISLKPNYLNLTNELIDYLEENPVKSFMYYQDTSMLYDNYDKPLDKFINNFYNFVDINKVMKTDIFFSKLDFGTDSNWVLPNEEVTSSLIFDQYKEYSYQFLNRQGNAEHNSDSLELTNIYLRSSNKNIINSRFYQKVTSFFADMSIFIEQGMFLLWVIVFKINENLFSNDIISKVMKYTNSKEYNLPKIIYNYKLIVESKKRNKNDSLPLYNNLQNYNDPYSNKKNNESAKLKPINPTIGEFYNEDILVELTRKQIPIQTEYKTRKLSTLIELEDPNEKLAKKTKKEREITIHEANYLKLCCCCLKSKDSKIKSKILEIGEEKILRSLDILVYLRKMQQIDVLRSSILTENEKDINDFLTNPILTVDEKKTEKLKEFYHANEDNSDAFAKRLLESYEEISNKKNKSYSENSLVNLFETEMEYLDEGDE